MVKTRNFRKNTSGQFVLLAALLMAIITFSLVLSIHQLIVRRQQLRYEQVEELVLGITSDLDRSLIHALSIASQQYYMTGSVENATNEGYYFISKWVRSVLASYSNLGIRMNMSVPTNATGGPTDVAWHLNWNKEIGLSQVYTKFDLDIDAYGFKGWVGQSGMFVMLRIFPDSFILTERDTTFRFQIMQGKDQATPIPNLTPESLEIWAFVGSRVSVPARVTSLSYLGGGNYTATFTPRVNEQTLGVDLTAVSPEDNIYVSAYYYRDSSERSVSVTLQSLEEDGHSENLGQIQLEASKYTLPNSVNTYAGTYLLRYFAQEGYGFLNWTISGSAFAKDPNSSITSVTIYGNCSITAFYKKTTVPETKIVNLFADSREQNNLTYHLGTISLNSTGYALPAIITGLITGDYTLEYQPYNSSQVFLFWESSGGTIPWNAHDSSTMVTVVGNGTVTAVYRFEPLPVRQVSVSLRSLEETSGSQNLGEIQLGETLFGLPNSTMVFNGSYLLEYRPAEGYTFLNWTTSGDITVRNPLSPITSVTITDNGTITAFYRGSKLSLNSRHWENLSFSLGSITLGTETYMLPSNITGLASGDYSIEYAPYNSSYVFLWWEFSGEVIPTSTVSNPTTLKVMGDGIVTAVYGSSLPVTTTISVSLRSLEEGAASQDLGEIQLGETLYGLPNSTTVFNGSYLLEYRPAEGYTFLNWTTSGDITVRNPHSSVTSVTVDGNGTITAFYRSYTPPKPAMFDLGIGSREQENITRHLGTISLNSSGYALPATITGLAAGTYTLEYLPHNSSYVFLWWESTDGAIPWNAYDISTMVTVVGNGTVTAVYRFVSTSISQLSVSLRSLEENSASENLGEIQLGETLFGLPNSTTVFNGSYLLEYRPAEGYTFLNWTTSGDITVRNSLSSITSVTIIGNGTITAFYKKTTGPEPIINLVLDSRHWANSSFNLGFIKLGASAYALPKSLTGLAQGDYFLQYTIHNESYAFLYWETSGEVIAWNYTSDTTALTVFEDGTVTAVYYLLNETKPPFNGTWDTLYVDYGYRLNPPFLWSGRSGHLPPSFSQGKDKQVCLLTSPLTPTIYLAPIVNVTAYLRPNPPENVKDITMELGFKYNGQYYYLGKVVYANAFQGVYTLHINVADGQYPGYTGVIPENSTILLTITITFYRQPWGTFFVYYGPDRPTNVELF